MMKYVSDVFNKYDTSDFNNPNHLNFVPRNMIFQGGPWDMDRCEGLFPVIFTMLCANYYGDMMDFR